MTGLPCVDGLEIVQEDRVLRVTIERGEDNLMSMTMCETLTGLLSQPPEGCHVMHLRAHGPRFCLGRDGGGEDVAVLRHQARTLVALNRALTEGQLVTVTEVAGDAAGFGVSLAALSGISVAARSARFWFPEIEFRLAPTVVLAWLPRIVGPRQAFRLTATAAKVDGEEAASLGIVTRAVSEDALERAVQAEIDALLAHTWQTQLEIRSFLSDTAGLDSATAYRMAADRLVLGSLRMAGKTLTTDRARAGPEPRDG